MDQLVPDEGDAKDARRGETQRAHLRKQQMLLRPFRLRCSSPRRCAGKARPVPQGRIHPGRCGPWMGGAARSQTGARSASAWRRARARPRSLEQDRTARRAAACSRPAAPHRHPSRRRSRERVFRGGNDAQHGVPAPPVQFANDHCLPCRGARQKRRASRIAERTTSQWNRCFRPARPTLYHRSSHSLLYVRPRRDPPLIIQPSVQMRFQKTG